MVCICWLQPSISVDAEFERVSNLLENKKALCVCRASLVDRRWLTSQLVPPYHVRLMAFIVYARTKLLVRIVESSGSLIKISVAQIYPQLNFRLVLSAENRQLHVIPRVGISRCDHIENNQDTA